MFKLLGDMEIDSKSIFLYKRAGRMYYSHTNLGKEIESGSNLFPIIENLPLKQFANNI